MLADSFTQTNLVSDIPGLAAHTDSNLINPWGVSFSGTSPFWVSNQGTGTSTLYDGAGNANPLVVTIPGSAGGPTGPTGQVFNSSGTGFLINGSSARFIFDNLNGSISGWNGVGTTAAVTVPSAAGTIYTGLAFNTAGGSNYLYAANSVGSINVFDSTWANVTGTTFAGKFVDPNAQAGFVPFNVQSVGANVYVTYAQLGPGGTPLPGGYVDIFDASGNFIRRATVSGPLFAPWGLTIAPTGFGSFSGDLLIGNFGNGEILAYDPLTGVFLGTINDANGNPIINERLWALATRTGGANNDLSAVYFTAGIGGEQHGLFGKLDVTPVPEPATLIETGSGLAAFAMAMIRRRKALLVK